MSEYAREFFLFNGLLMPTSAFEQHFGQPQKYIYEVFRVQNGIPLFIEDHLERLWQTAAFEQVKLDFSQADLLHNIMRVVQANTQGDGNLKIAIHQSGHLPVSTLIYFTPHQYPTPDQFLHGVPVGLFFAERHNPNAKVMDMDLRKTTDDMKAAEGFYEVLLVDRDGFITEGSRSNVFFVRKNLLITPPVETVLEGVTRKQILRLCTNYELLVLEEKVHHDDLGGFDALFLSGTSRRVLPVNQVNSRLFSTSHPLMKHLQLLFEERVQNYLKAFTHKLSPKV